ncbi:MAG TPA: alpha/beta hydrolase [Usitatibacter sp.]|nr:alpha/beta hydrolase [Usitatibacter sp.]
MKPAPTQLVTIAVSPGGRLEAALAVPPRPIGMVLFAHGNGSGRTSPGNVQVADALNAARIATLLFDLLTPSEEASEGLRLDVGLLSRRLLEATRWVTRQEAIAGLAPAYFGASTGAAAALVAAAELGARVRAVVARGGRPDLAGDAIGRVQSPTLLIVGGADTAGVSANRGALTRLGGEREMVVIPNATHLFPEVGAMETVTQYAVDWFARCLESRALRAAT